MSYIPNLQVVENETGRLLAVALVSGQQWIAGSGTNEKCAKAGSSQKEHKGISRIEGDIYTNWHRKGEREWIL